MELKRGGNFHFTGIYVGEKVFLTSKIGHASHLEGSLANTVNLIVLHFDSFDSFQKMKRRIGHRSNSIITKIEMLQICQKFERSTWQFTH